MIRAAVIAILLSAMLGCATADLMQLADSATTAVGMESGFSEGNPVFHGAGWPVIAAVKIGVTQGAKLLPTPYCDSALFGLTVTGFVAACWNVGVMLGSGLAAIPFALAITWDFWDRWRDDAQLDCAVADQTVREWGLKHDVESN